MQHLWEKPQVHTWLYVMIPWQNATREAIKRLDENANLRCTFCMTTDKADTRSILSAAFLLDGIPRLSPIPEKLLPQARLLAENIGAYAALNPKDATKKSFLLTRCFGPETPEYQTVRKFLSGRVAPDTVQPLATVAEVALYSGPSDPDPETVATTDFMSTIVDPLQQVSEQGSVEAAGSVMLHSHRDQPPRGRTERWLAKYVGEKWKQGRFGEASYIAEVTVVAGGSNPSTEVEKLLQFQLRNFEKIAHEAPNRGLLAARNVFLYAPMGSSENTRAEDKLLDFMQGAALTGDTEKAVTIGWLLLRAGNNDRTPRQHAIEYLQQHLQTFTIASQKQFIREVASTYAIDREENREHMRRSFRSGLRNERTITLLSHSGIPILRGLQAAPAAAMRPN